MIERVLIVLFLAMSSVHAETLEYGMSEEDVKIELGRPELKMALGGKEVWIYTDGTKLEFVDGQLNKQNDTALLAPRATSGKPSGDENPLIRAEDMVEQPKEKTITMSVQPQASEYTSMTQNNTKSLQNLEDAINAGEADQLLSEEEEVSSSALMSIGVSFAVELVVTLIVLSIAFQISGFPSIFRQILLLSLSVALVGAVFDTILELGPLNPIRSVAGFVILMVLIRQLTDVREWATAIKIAILARVVSIVMVWLLMLGATMLLNV